MKHEFGAVRQIVCIFLLSLALAGVSLARDEGIEVLHRHADGTPGWIQGDLGSLTLPVGLDEGSSRFYEALYQELNRRVPEMTSRHLGVTGREEVKIVSFHVDRDRVAHLSYRQSMFGLPIEGSGFRVRFSLDSGRIIGYNGRVFRQLEAGMPADAEALDFEAALATAFEEWDGKVLEGPELTFLADGSQLTLAYQAIVEMPGYFGPQRIWVAVANGEYLGAEPEFLQVLPSSILNDKNPIFGTKQKFRTRDGLTVVLAANPNNGFQYSDFKLVCDSTVAFPVPGLVGLPATSCSTDPSISRAHLNGSDIFSYYYQKHGWSSWNGAHAPMESVVHMLDPENFTLMNNAYWRNGRMHYGDGDGSILLDTTLGFDVAAHEMTHGVTETISQLIYRWQPGAINESLSDIFGAAAEAWKEGSVTEKTWQIGEEIVGPEYPHPALRFMNDPTLDGYSPDFYPELIYPDPCTPDPEINDNCGVHGNSGIGNLAFYLLSEGGSHPHGKTSNWVTGIGIEKAAEIFFASQWLLNPNDDYPLLRIATEQAAFSLYGPAIADSVSDAWDAVGVP